MKNDLLEVAGARVQSRDGDSGWGSKREDSHSKANNDAFGLNPDDGDNDADANPDGGATDENENLKFFPRKLKEEWHASLLVGHDIQLMEAAPRNRLSKVFQAELNLESTIDNQKVIFSTGKHHATAKNVILASVTLDNADASMATIFVKLYHLAYRTNIRINIGTVKIYAGKLKKIAIKSIDGSIATVDFSTASLAFLKDQLLVNPSISTQLQPLFTIAGQSMIDGCLTVVPEEGKVNQMIGSLHEFAHRKDELETPGKFPLQPWFAKTGKSQYLDSSTMVQATKRPTIQPLLPFTSYPDRRLYHLVCQYGTQLEHEHELERRSNANLYEVSEAYIMRIDTSLTVEGKVLEFLLFAKLGDQPWRHPREGEDFKIIIETEITDWTEAQGIEARKHVTVEEGLDWYAQSLLHGCFRRYFSDLSDNGKAPIVEKLCSIANCNNQEATAMLYGFRAEKMTEEMMADWVYQLVETRFKAGLLGPPPLFEQNISRPMAVEFPSQRLAQSPFEDCVAYKCKVPTISQGVGEGEEGAGTRVLPSYKLPFVQVFADETVPQFRRRLMKNERSVAIKFRVDDSGRTSRAEINMNANLFDPARAYIVPISAHSQAAYNYVQAFQASGTVDLVKTFPQLAPVFKPEDHSIGPALSSMKESLNPEQLKAFMRLQYAPDGVQFLVGTVGSGKTYVSVFLAYCFGLLAEENVAFVTNTNQGVSDLAHRLCKQQQDIGVPEKDRIRVIKVSSLDATMKQTTGKIHSSTDFTPGYDLEVGEAMVNPGNLEGVFHALTIISRYTHDHVLKKRAETAQKFEMSLAEACVEAFEEAYLKDPGTYVWLAWIHNGMVQDQKPDPPAEYRFGSAKDEIRDLACQVLRRPKTFIVGTPVAIEQTNIRVWFRPSMVIFDEASRATDSSTNIAIGAFPTCQVNLFVGDPRQMQPVALSGDHERARNQGTRRDTNPFSECMKESMIARADKCSVFIATDYIRTNHRAKASGLVRGPSDSFYNMMMESGNTKDSQTTVQAVKSFLGTQFHLPTEPRDNTVLVKTCCDANKTRSSWENHLHAGYICRRVVVPFIKAKQENEILAPLSLLIITMYKPQVDKYRSFLEGLYQDGSLTREEINAVNVRTVDGSQGYEADLVVVDYVRGSWTGMCRVPNRNLVAQTRAVYGMVIVASENMLGAYEKGKDQLGDPTIDLRVFANTKCISAMFDTYAHATVAPPIHTCYGVAGEDCNCPKKTVTEGEEIDQYQEVVPEVLRSDDRNLNKHCSNCGQVGHPVKACLSQCILCKSNTDEHLPRDCKNGKRRRSAGAGCKICHSKEHYLNECPYKDKCLHCKSTEHRARDCPVKPAVDPTTVECRKCHEVGHIKAQCPVALRNMLCHKCRRRGHKALMCRFCRHCKDENADHQPNDCPRPGKPCNRCGKDTHLESRCPKNA